MRLTLVICAIGLVLAAHVADAQAPAGKAQIVGRVIDADTNTPIAGARVMATPAIRPVPGTGGAAMPMRADSIAAETDEAGRFVIDGVPPGRVRVSVQKPGYASDPMSRPIIDVPAGQATEFNVSLRRGGVLAGRILDERGEPLADIRVMALRRLSDGAEQRAMINGPGSITNDLGEFRLAGLEAGNYVVTAGAQSPSPFTVNLTDRTTRVPTFYPGTTNRAQAQVVSLAPADTVAGLEFRMVSVPAFRVSGIAVDGTGKPVDDAIVTLNPGGRGLREVPVASSLSGRTKADGTFVIGGVIAGSYAVMANRVVRAPVGGGTITGGIVAGINQFQQEVHVDGADVSGLRVIVSPQR